MKEMYKKDLLDDLKSLISIPSVLDALDDQFPFGENINKALEKMLEICERLGFKTYYNEYYGYAEVGTGEELIGVLGHLDVVPAGDLNQWETNPFEGVIKDGKLYGRGAQDDKGPTLAAMYGVKALIDEGIELNKRIRFIFGLDEENLWRSIDQYLENEEQPDYGFTPDSVFPMINAEKGLLQAKIILDEKSPIDLVAGNAFNAVPEGATYTGEEKEALIEVLESLDYAYEFTEDGIEVIGISSHASKPSEGINAIGRLVEALSMIGYESKSIQLINQVFNKKINGEGFIENCFDEVSGPLTVNLGKVEMNDFHQMIGLDIRIPVTIEKDIVVAKLKEKVETYGFKYHEYDYLKSIHIPKDHFMVEKLRKVFEEATGLDSTPLSSGGATYARAIDNCLAYGALFPGDEKVEHKANEYIKIENLYKCVDIYTKTIKALLE
jgi:predicted dipeptidase